MNDHKNYKIVITGAGGIGRAVGLLLAEYADFEGSIYLGDHDLRIASEASAWISAGNTKGMHPETFHFIPGYEYLDHNVFADADIVLDCLPGSEAPRIGAIAKKYNLHYANLTEYVHETEQLKALARHSDKGFILQTGLAPGFINILALSLYRDFTRRFNNNQVEYIGMKVGALSENAEAPHFYGFTWSPIGVATEYLKDAWVINNYQKTSVPSLSAHSPIIIGGTTYEEDYTSGGAADLPDVFCGLARTLEYKTLRYPGHFEWIKKVLKEAPPNENPIDFLDKRMRSIVPTTDKDIVVLYSTVKGYDQHSQLRSVEKALKIGPVKVGNTTLRAIQATTAAPLAECARMLLSGQYRGVTLQSQIDPLSFFNGPFIRHVYFAKENSLPAEVHEATIAA